MSILTLVALLFDALYMLILAGVLLSWVELGAGRASWLYHPAINFVREWSYRIIRPFRNFLEKIGLRTGPIDFSPVIAIVVLQFVIQPIVMKLLIAIGIR